MAETSVNSILRYLKDNKKFFYDKFGVTSLGIFGSFVQNKQTDASDIDIIVEFEKSRKNIHNFFNFKRFLESELGVNVDLGTWQALKPPVKEKIEGKILYA